MTRTSKYSGQTGSSTSSYLMFFADYEYNQEGSWMEEFHSPEDSGWRKNAE